MFKIFEAIYYKIISANKVAKIVGVNFGSNCRFGSKSFGSEPYLIYIGDNFRTSSGVKFITHDGSVHVLRNLYKELRDIDLFKKIEIHNNVFIGLDCIILPGTKIGDNVIVGAGSVVRGELKPNSVYAGVPIKYICSIDEYKDKNKDSFVFTKHMCELEKRKMIINHFQIK